MAEEGQWSSWEKQPCSATCGEGKTVEHRFCGTVAQRRVLVIPMEQNFCYRIV